jgi:hypothetical protein
MTAGIWVLRILFVVGVVGLGITLVSGFDLASEPSKYRFPIEQGGDCYASLEAYRGCLWSRGWTYASLSAASAVLLFFLKKKRG